MAEDSISIVIPVFNAEETLVPLVTRLLGCLQPRSAPVEVILVNDGSHDGSWAAIQELSAAHPEVRGIDLMRNYGQHNALLCGIRLARYNVVVTMDDDLQHPPEELPKLLSMLAQGYDVVYGTPDEERHGLWRDLASQLTKLVLRGAMGVETARKVSAFRVFRAQLRDAFAHYSSPYVSIDVLLAWSTTRFASVRVRHDPRPAGRSGYTFGKLVVHALNMMTGFSTWPLQLAGLIGFAFAVFGMGVLIYVLGRYLIQGGSVPGFPFLASVIAIFSGAQLLALGIIGQYLARMHYRMMDRPTYAVRSTAGREE